MAERCLPSDWKICATCTHWCGSQEPDAFNSGVKFDPNEKAKCAAGSWSTRELGALEPSCGKWEQRFKR